MKVSRKIKTLFLNIATGSLFVSTCLIEKPVLAASIGLWNISLRPFVNVEPVFNTKIGVSNFTEYLGYAPVCNIFCLPFLIRS